MTKVIKEEFEKLESLKIGDDSFACNTSLELFYEEFNRMSKMDDDLFTYENAFMEYIGVEGDDEVKLTDEESSGSKDEDEVAEIFKIDTNVFDFETPMCRAFKKINYLLQIDPDVLTKNIKVHVIPWTDNGVSEEPTPVRHHWNLPGAYIVGNTLRFQDLEWYEALKDSKIKEEALKNKAIIEGIIEEDDESSNEGWRR
ncbi:hypothetical protein Tco_0772125 [Tanacetum coccineum]|uniref:Uncharacterized protein n=1 Tax=Tanacetum coccineum TaxID=301880 RepID=A0ABQ4ZH10_9ASTR